MDKHQKRIEDLGALVNQFKQHGTKADEYNTRAEYIDELFSLLGWDMYNKIEKAPAHLKQVLREDTVYINGGAKAPDYSFRIDGKRMFFVEAKKPNVNIHDNPDYAFQARSYGYSASEIPVVILTDFQEFSVYDANIKPKEGDNAGVARLKYFTCDEYTKPEVFAYLWDTFSLEAVREGSLNKYAKEVKKGGESFDTDFLKSLSGWRLKLADAIFLKNKDLHEIHVNFAVQKIMNRLIFLRFAEDRGTSDYGALQAIARKNENRYQTLKQLFDEARTVYNSDLFGTEPSDKDKKAEYIAHKKLLDELIVDDKTIKEIIDDLYFPKSPYAFSVIPIELLGTIYERFLGQKIIRGKYNRAEAVDKIENRKGQGIYYTPAYIVDYIVQNTLGKSLEGKTPEDIQTLSVVDPACGSGSFLIAVYDSLLRWYLHYYSENKPQDHIKTNKIVKRNGEYTLTVVEKQQILLRHVFGVDLDSQAVEVSKLSLMLKLMEGENHAREGKLTFLPNLEDNIQWGNSLISPDYTKDIQPSLWGIEQQHKIKVFDWQKAFPEVFKRGGFDCVVGNPPWGADIDSLLDYFAKYYPNSTKNHKDSFKLFIEKGIKITKLSGTTAMIVPSAFMFQPRYKDIRIYMRENTTINYLWNIGDGVFGSIVTAPCCIFITQKQTAGERSQCKMLDTTHLKTEADRITTLKNINYTPAHQRIFKDAPEEAFAVYKKMEGNLVPLKDLMDFKDAGINYQRVNVGLKNKGNSDLSTRLLYEGTQERTIDIEYWKGTDINKYFIADSTNRFVRPDIFPSLKKNERVILNKEYFSLTPKLIWRQTASYPIATIDSRGVWFGRSIQAAILKNLNSTLSLEYILGIFNSKYFRWLYEQSVKESERVFPQIKLAKLEGLPIPNLDLGNKAQKAQHDDLVCKVQQMLDFHKKLNAAKDIDKPVIQNQIQLLDNQIDDLVYKLYDLDEGEIKIVEGDNLCPPKKKP